jgi:hypothetical protein
MCNVTWQLDLSQFFKNVNSKMLIQAKQGPEEAWEKEKSSMAYFKTEEAESLKSLISFTLLQTEAFAGSGAPREPQEIS